MHRIITDAAAWHAHLAREDRRADDAMHEQFHRDRAQDATSVSRPRRQRWFRREHNGQQ